MDIHDADKREALHYLGYREQEANEAVTAMVRQSMAELWEAATPRRLYREYPLILGEDYRIDGGCFKVRGRSLWGNLKDYDQIIVFAATPGRGAGHLTQKYSRLRIGRAVVMQAVAATMVEEYCDQACTMIKSEYEAKSRCLCPRFSPGCGDSPLEYQRMFLEALEVGKRINIKLTDSLLMMPSKSVSAVMGVSKKSYRCGVKDYEAYAKTDCPYRRQQGTAP